MNDLVVIPDLCIKEVNFILSVKVYTNGELYQDTPRPYYHSKRLTRKQNDLYRFYSKFIYKSRHYNPIQPLLNINRYLNNELWLKTYDIRYKQYDDYEGELFENSKFITKKEERINPKAKPYQAFYNHSTKPIPIQKYEIKVEYINIREEIISYLIQKYPNDKYIQAQVNELRPLFDNTGDITDYETALKKRIEYLTNIDYDKYALALNCNIEELKKQREQKNGNNN